MGMSIIFDEASKLMEKLAALLDASPTHPRIDEMALAMALACRLWHALEEWKLKEEVTEGPANVEAMRYHLIAFCGYYEGCFGDDEETQDNPSEDQAGGDAGDAVVPDGEGRAALEASAGSASAGKVRVSPWDIYRAHGGSGRPLEQSDANAQGGSPAANENGPRHDRKS